MSAVPKLRFPEFNGVFEAKLLEEIANVYQPKTISQSDLIPDGEYVVYGANGVIGRYSAFNHEAEQVAITCRGNTCGRVNFTPAKAWITGNAMVLNMDANADVYKKFIYYLSTATDWTYQIAGSGQPQITGTIKKHKFQIPSLPEQQKIATFLSSIDKKIDLLRQKKNELELYKKGLMQKIFSQEIRFKQDDGNDFSDWEEVALGAVVKIRTGKKDVNQGNSQGSYPFFTCAKHNTYSDTYSFDCDAILIAGNGEVGHSQRFSGKFEAYQRTYVLSDFKLQFDYTFVVVNNLFKEFVNKQVQTGAMPYIRLSTLKDFLIPCPSPEEQLKIASLFSKIDQKIQNTSSQIEQMETFKKGLLQQMFV